MGRRERRERRRRRRRERPTFTDERLASQHKKRDFRRHPEENRHAVKDVVTEGDPLWVCDHMGFPTSLRDTWKNRAGFLVCGGPSVRDVEYGRLAERGVVSLGVNNVAGFVPVNVMTCSDPPTKFHHGIWLDPKILKLIPRDKMKKKFRIKHEDGTFTEPENMKVYDCPNVYGYLRSCAFRPEEFLTCNAATWGNNNNGVAKTGRDKLLFTMLLGLRLCYYLGLRRTYLLGVDFNISPERGYAFAQGRDEKACTNNRNSYRVANKWLHELKPILSAAGMEVYNCNKESLCSAFGHVPFDKAMSDCKSGIPDEPFDLEGWYEK